MLHWTLQDTNNTPSKSNRRQKQGKKARPQTHPSHNYFLELLRFPWSPPEPEKVIRRLKNTGARTSHDLYRAERKKERPTCHPKATSNTIPLSRKKRRGATFMGGSSVNSPICTRRLKTPGPINFLHDFERSEITKNDGGEGGGGSSFRQFAMTASQVSSSSAEAASSWELTSCSRSRASTCRRLSESALLWALGPFSDFLGDSLMACFIYIYIYIFL